MVDTKTLLLDKKAIQHRIDRIAYQLYEDNYKENELFIAGIHDRGYILAKKIEKALAKLSNMNTTLLKLEIDKDNPLSKEIEIDTDVKMLKGKVVVVVDDVLNSGKTLMYSLRPFLEVRVKKLRTVLLIDRDHKRYPIRANYVGLRLSTTLKEHVSVNLKSGEEAVYLE
ncbi:MAG: phosphoribosyltransferase [Bacteroidia bacterium]|nr:phosphoribosyltransferase [Bacteroidia bacterium]NNC85913.1 phosphoribosyltransferase [Bacteroidia bacterium]NNM16453.1 phosphoribosyltransferase [Bacteroidia bacterium]